MTATAPVGGALVAVLLTVLAAAGPAGAAVWAARRLWQGRPSLAAAYALLGGGAAALVVFFTWVVSPTAGQVVAWAGVLGTAGWAVVGTVRAGRRHELLPLLRAAAPVLLVSAGLLVGTVGLFLLWGGPSDLFHLARVRFSHPLPNDNELSALLAARLLDGEDPRPLVGDWQSSDRPPLQAGALLAVEAVTAWTGLPRAVLAFAASTTVQLAWAPVAYALCRSLGIGRRGALLGLVVAGASGSVLVNTVFTWPKLLSAGFLLAALAVAADLRRSDRSAVVVLPVIAVLTAFAVLSHGTSFFALPVLAAVLWPVRRTPGVRGWSLAVLAGVVAYAPWLLYQRFYDPPGDRLLTWHLAGVPEPTGRPFLDVLREAYAELPLATVVENKLTNLVLPVSVPPWGVVEVGSIPPDLRVTQFFIISGAVGVAALPCAVVLVAAAAAWRRGGGDVARRVAGLLAAAAGSLVFWALLMFGPGATYLHQGSHVPVLLACVLPAAWLAHRGRTGAAAAGAVLAVQLGTAAVVYGPSGVGGPLHAGACAALAAGAALCALGIATARVPAEGGEPATTGRRADPLDDATRPLGPARPRPTAPAR